jgi:hypothetical protein
MGWRSKGEGRQIGEAEEAEGHRVGKGAEGGLLGQGVPMDRELRDV